jgi:hypothetical protein
MKELQRSRAGEQLYTSLGRGIRAALDSRPESESALFETSPQVELFSTETDPKQMRDAQEPRISPQSTATKVARRKAVPQDSTEKEDEISKGISSPKETSSPSKTAASAKAATSQKTNENNSTGEAAEKRKPKKAKLKTQIAELSAQGIPPAKIASRLKLSLAEVDLALNLLQRPGGNQP